MSQYPIRRRQRLAAFDYTTAGFYFVTICVQDRLPLFGQVVSGAMEHSPACEMMEQILTEIPARYPGVLLDTWMTMPDHVHLILSLDGTTASLSEILHWFKSRSTARYAEGVRGEGWRRFAETLWQRGFFDHIIRTDDELQDKRGYVATNPQRWELRP